MISLVLPYPPSKNRLTRRVRTRGGYREYPSEAKLAFLNAVALVCRAKRVKPQIGELTVSIRAFRGNDASGRLSHGDGHNIEEILFDALQGYAYLNDYWIGAHHFERFEDRANPRVEIEIWPREEVQVWEAKP